MFKKVIYFSLGLFIALSFVFIYKSTRKSYLEVGISYGKIEQKTEIINFFLKKDIPSCKEIGLRNIDEKNIFIENKADSILYVENAKKQFLFCRW